MRIPPMIIRRLLLVLAAALALPAATAAEVRLIAGTIPGFCEAKGESVGGASCALVAEMARRMHYPRKIELMPFIRALETVRLGRNVIMPLGRSKARENNAQWRVVLLEDEFVLITQKHPEEAVDSLGAVRDKAVGAMRGGIAVEIAHAGGLTRLEEVAEEPLNARKLAAGRIVAWIGAWNSIRQAQRQAGLPVADLRRAAVLQRFAIYLAASRDVPAEELDKWKAVLDAMRADGTYRRILAEYDYEVPQSHAKPASTPAAGR
ncbi:ABC transporter substrate-binding protein [Massilia sp. YIM B04103]|uniref:substrate-binding periplasmic protein n=1 Tax=Massilia sp. YIM B04103 TaxID=2963106 RepID=UPI00210C3845|nr:transporter substrate-binding domain-containing protein [Massilia sp. YIM B04103]